MQYVPIEAMLEMSAIFAGLFFIVIAIVAVYHYAMDVRFRRWAISMILFWIAFLPVFVLANFYYMGDFISSLLRVYGAAILLKAFGYTPLRKYSNKTLHPILFVIMGAYWIPIVLFGFPNTSGAIISSALMAFAFAYAGREILNFTHNRTLGWMSAGLSYISWSIFSIPMILLPLFPQINVFGYLQFISQCLVLVTMFLAFFGSITRRLERNLKLTEITGSLISHDLRNYLNVTQSALDLIIAKDDDSEEMLQTAKDTITKASEFIKNVRSVLIDIGMHSIAMDDIDLSILVNDVINRIKLEHQVDDSQLEVIIHDSAVACTSPLMAQVIWNIIDNSITHSPDTPQIVVSIQTNSNAVVAISDKSGGLSEELKEKLLTRGNDANGLGLGLMLIREISNVCSVVLKVEDRYEEDSIIGTTYYLEFPAAGGIPP
ncbi:MAG: sensor histidine kinase, partial [Candidatus Thorarchaeota archaeon]